eukprot:gene14956-44235_t
MDRMRADAEANGQRVLLTFLNIANPAKTGRMVGVLPLRVGHRYGE